MTTEIKNLDEYMEIGKTGVKVDRTVKFGGKEFLKTKEEGYSFWDEKTGKYSVFTKSGYTKHYTGADHNISDVITSDAELGKMYRIMRNLNNMNMIMYKDSHTKKGSPADRPLLYELTGYGNSNSARRFINKMIELGIIKEGNIGGNERFFINPLYTMIGSGITLMVYQLFKEQLDPFLTEQAKIDLGELCYYENNPSEYIALERKKKQEQEEAADALLDKMFSPEREQELALEEALDNIPRPDMRNVLATKNPEDDCDFIESILKNEEIYGSLKESDTTIVLAITPNEMTREKRLFLIDAISSYKSHRDQDQLVRNTFGLLKKVQKETAMLAGTTVSNEIFA